MGDAAEKMKSILNRVWPIGIIFALWLMFSFPYWGKGLVPFPSKYLVTFFAPWSSLYGMPVKNNAMPDVITQIYPWKRVTVSTWKDGEIPLWNPYSFAGTMHAGNYQSAIFSPVNLLFFFLPEIHAWSIMILLQPLLAGLFMYLFLRSMVISREGSVLGSLAFMFCGFIVVWMAYGTLGYAALFLPLVLYAVNALMTRGQRWAGPLISVSIGLSFLSGHFQISLYVLLYTFLYILFAVVASKKWERLLIAFVSVVVGILFAAPQIVPALDAYRTSLRSSIFTNGEIISWQYIITIFSPDFYGNPVTRNDWFGHYAEWSSFVGVVPLLLAVSLWFTRPNNRNTIFFSAMAGMFLLFALPTPLTSLLYAAHIPVLSTSAASRIIILVSFSLAVLSGFGLDAVRVSWEKRSYNKMIAWGLTALVFIMGLWIILYFLRPLPPEKLVVAIRNTILPTLYLGATLFVVGLGYVLHTRFRHALPYLLIVLAATDALRFAVKWMPFDPKEYVYPRLTVIEKTIRLTAENHAHVFGNIGNEVGSAFGIQLLEGYDAVYQERYGRFISAITTGIQGSGERSVVKFDKRGVYSEEVLRLLGVRYYVHKKSDGRFPWAYPFWEFPDYRSVWEDDHFQILENTKSLPRAFLASSYKVITDDQAILDALFSPETDRRQTLILEVEPSVKPATGPGEATIQRYTSNNIQIHTSADTPKLLFLSDVFDPEWHAAVDGKPVQLYRADYDFRAVAVPAGTHIVRMWYWPKSITWGLIAFGFGTLWCVGVFLARKRI